MTLSHHVLRFATLSAALCAAGAAHAQDSFADAFWQFRASAGFDYSAGKYGATVPTDVYYAYTTLRASKGPWTFNATVPWIRVVGPAVLLDGTSGGSVGTGVSRDVDGIGDIVLTGGYSLQSLYADGWFVDFSARVKAPTASFSKGLGTGRTDVAGQIDIAKSFGKFMPFFTAGYRLTGSPAGFPLRDIVYGTVGLQYTWSDKVVTGVMFDYRQASLPTAKDPQEGSVYLNYKFAEAWSVNLYGVVGFSRNSPDGGGGLVITYRWP